MVTIGYLIPNYTNFHHGKKITVNLKRILILQIRSFTTSSGKRIKIHSNYTDLVVPDFDWLKTAMPFSDDSDWLTYFSRDFIKPVTKLVSLNGLGMWTLLR